jgi:dimethylhistidine N-methyltransferase
MSEDVYTEQSTFVPSETLVDLEPDLEQFREDVLSGMSRDQKEIPCKYLYDERGSQLFDAICELEEYYPTRTEVAIMNEHGAEMAGMLGPGCLLIEYGSGSSTKTPILLRHLPDPAGYVPVDISREHLVQASERLGEQFPDLTILPVCADYTRPFDIPEPDAPVRRRAVYYPGSTIGNFHPTEAQEFLSGIAEVCDTGGALLLGVDLIKPRSVLEAAYNDREGVTAEFNLNLIKRINRELWADFVPERFEHRAVWVPEHSRIEMRLISQGRQVVSVSGRPFALRDGEWILTECSYKYMLDQFAELASKAGFTVERVWTDDQQRFSVQYLTVK